MTRNALCGELIPNPAIANSTLDPLRFDAPAVHVQLGCLFLAPPSPICAARSSSRPGASNGQSCNARSRQPTCLARSPLHMVESHAAVDDSLGRALGGRPIRQRTDSAHGDMRAAFDPARMRSTTRWNKPTARATRDGASGASDHHRPGLAWDWDWGRPRASLPQSPHASFGCASEPRRADDLELRHRDTHARTHTRTHVSFRFALIWLGSATATGSTWLRLPFPPGCEASPRHRDTLDSIRFDSIRFDPISIRDALDAPDALSRRARAITSAHPPTYLYIYLARTRAGGEWTRPTLPRCAQLPARTDRPTARPTRDRASGSRDYRKPGQAAPPRPATLRPVLCSGSPARRGLPTTPPYGRSARPVAPCREGRNRRTVSCGVPRARARAIASAWGDHVMRGRRCVERGSTDTAPARAQAQARWAREVQGSTTTGYTIAVAIAVAVTTAILARRS
ncbi:hypothetical protein HETIRDRAFT_452323 [Heterobasidion irregulare TC 32-1]|uniref:Uncharacterized protein n=1 Tax=Heterobasidion irregulare (strain TC 32-1) TaxID=747525 RepID=W4K672_HETIT|nr:uncharacterized protein HETIRDRAFT_452323 [Heterobasidion irregulare TC 32-1]ETW80835.1 hypothetical protein HETIRDRAFT_452323 [Heterobasidion irregulare TC 32-1]